MQALGRRGGVSAVEVLSRVARSERLAVAVAAAQALGNVREAAAADALEGVARAARDKAVQKTARRSIHRLSSQGIRAQAPVPVASPASGLRKATLYRVVASAFDGAGTRAVWFAAERPLGGIYQVAVTINDLQGLTDCVGHDTTRKRFAEREATIRDKDPMAWAELPSEYAKQLVQEAVEVGRQAGLNAPAGYAIWADLIGSPEEPFQRALVYGEISAMEVRLHPTLERESPQIFDEPEVEPWFFAPDRVRKWVQQLMEPQSSRLIVTLESPEARTERLVREAVKELLPKPALHGLRRRLEETAYIFLRSDRSVAARRAVAAAATLEEERPLQPPHPFIRVLVERSLRIGMGVERSSAPPSRLIRLP